MFAVYEHYRKRKTFQFLLQPTFRLPPHPSPLPWGEREGVRGDFVTLFFRHGTGALVISEGNLHLLLEPVNNCFEGFKAIGFGYTFIVELPHNIYSFWDSLFEKEMTRST